MTTFHVNNNYIKNILNIGNKQITNCPCKVHINNERDIEIPLLVALSTFQSFQQILDIDPTIHEFNIDIDFCLDEENNQSDSIRNTFYDKFTEILYGLEVTLNSEEIIMLAKIGKFAHNDYFIAPYQAKLKTLEETLSLSNALIFFK